MSTSHNSQLAIVSRAEREPSEPEINFEPLLDCEEAASLLRIHPRTLVRKARKGLIPAIHVGKLWRFRASALNAWLNTIAS